MLTTCPKCGFSQPKDQYCAQCGIDMSAYQAPDKSLVQKLSENLFVQLSLVILIGIIAVMMITRNQQESFWTRVQFLRGSSTQISQSEDANQFSSNAEIDTSEQSSEPNQVAGETVTLPTEVKAKTAVSPQAKIYYLEIPQVVLNKWLEEGVLTRVETSDGITIGYIPQLNQALEQYKAQIRIIKQDSYAYNLNQLYTAKLEKPLPAPENLNGRSLASTENQLPPLPPSLTTYATLDDDRNETLSGQVEVSVNPQTSFPAHFEMTSDQSFFIAGFDKMRPADRNSPNGNLNEPATETVVVLKIDK